MENFTIEALNDAARELLQAKENSEIPAVRAHCLTALQEIETAIKLAATLTDEDLADAVPN